jgi:hypothetical protein
MFRRRIAAGVVAVFTVIACASNANAVNQPALPREGDVRFKVTCQWDHAAPDDPIVYPNQDGAAHRHNFFGKKGVDENTTTYTQLVDGNDQTTCNDPEDLAAYWAPALRLHSTGTWEKPSRLTVYYRRGEKRGTIQPIPDGLKIIAGYPTTHNPDGLRITGYQCGEGLPVELSAIPNPCTEGFKMVVRFPDCWDGVNLDSADHRSHMAYAVWDTVVEEARVCLSTHPVPLPQLTEYVSFNTITNKNDVNNLSSGTTDTVHMDFFNGWVTSRMANRVDFCLNQFNRCDSGG